MWRIVTDEEQAALWQRRAQHTYGHMLRGGCPRRIIYDMLCTGPVTKNGLCRWHNNPRPRCGICGRFVARWGRCVDAFYVGGGDYTGWEHR